ncbi:MAG: cobalamin B12-binding domain-containing protein [Syntrophaceae bacterium]|nr:cobalamin B12-binding domain-containing protein [Syntrophaceae bacterium]
MGIKETNRIPRVLVAKIGLDGHSRGAQVVAYGLRDAGMEVIYTGIRQTPAGVARTAIEEGVDVIGISSMVGAHMAIMKKLRKELEKLNAADLPVILGGIIPEEDYDQLRRLGASAIFSPGSELKEIIHFFQQMAKAKEWISEVPGTLAGKYLDDLHLSGTQCERCGQVYFPSRRNCPHCLDDRSIKQIPLSDEGTLHTFVVADMAPPGYPVPHAQGYIDLFEKGPRIFSLLTDYGEPSNLKIGCKMSLKVVRLGRDRDHRMIVGYRFRPSGEVRKGEID